MGVSQMPLWLEILINVTGYAGFIAIAMYHKPRNGNSPDQNPVTPFSRPRASSRSRES